MGNPLGPDLVAWDRLQSKREAEVVAVGQAQSHTVVGPLRKQEECALEPLVSG